MNEPLDDAIDARLRAAFAPPSPPQLAAAARAAVAEPAARPLWPWLLAAAALLLVFGLYALRSPRGPEGHDGAQLGAMWAAAYEHALTNGFGGGSCCDPQQDFGIVCEQKFAVKLEVAGGVTLHGCYCGLPTGGGVAVLADTADGPVGVFAVPRGRDPRPRLPAGCPLQLARRELGPVVLYAISRSAPGSSLEPFRLVP